MTSPVKNQINTVFIHVENLEKSVEWYTRLLDQKFEPSEISRPVYNLKINHHTGLTLDAGPEGEKKEVQASTYPLFNLHTDRIEDAYKYVVELNYEIASEIVQFDDFAYFTVLDPDKNVVMICTG